MTDTVAQIIALLSEKEGLMKELIHLLEQEQRAIVDMDLPALEQTDDQKRQLLVQLEDSNNAFRQLLRDAAMELHVTEGADLSSILAFVSSPQRTTLQGLQSRLLKLGTGLERITDFNRELLQGSLRMINRSLDFFGGVFRRCSTYGNAGSMVTAPTDVRLVCREI